MTDRKTALLESAIRMIARNGTRGMRVDEVARDAGVSPALIYHYFGDRSNLLREALLHISQRAEEYSRPPAGASGREALMASVVDEIQDDPDVRDNSAAWGELRDAAIFDPSLRPTLADLTQQWVDNLAQLIRKGHADGSVDYSVDPEEAAQRLSALVEGMSGRWLADLMTPATAREILANGVTRELAGAAQEEGSRDSR